jgi:16S rRNA (adenine(1408)-N(1))-methyltransferase
VIIDLGTGDGRAALAAAAREPGSFVLGIDASAASMAESSRRAARSAAKGGLPNALFVVSAVEALPRQAAGWADEALITFPWGSLLRGAIGLDTAVADAIARIVNVGGQITILLSVTERDGIPEVPCLDEVAVEQVGRRHATRGLELVAARQATAEDLASARSSWAQRLRSDTARPIWRLVFTRRDETSSSEAGP